MNYIDYMKFFITFGQTHTHSINCKTFDKDCIAIIYADNYDKGRALAFKYFGQKWCFIYPEKDFNMDDMEFYHRGFIKVQL